MCIDLSAEPDLKGILADLALKTGEEVKLGKPVSGGKNNCAWQVTAGSKPLFLKYYGLQGKGGDGTRFYNEVNFFRLIQDDVNNVARLITSSEEKQYAAFSYYPSSAVESVDADTIMLAADFIANINAPRIQQKATQISQARGALTTVSAFINELQNRYQKMNNVTAKEDVDRRMLSFVNQQWLPLFEKYRQKVSGALRGQKLIRCISPSDFGFHNAFMAENLYFCDFEYAGWDSLEKLICDFFAQPRYEISLDMLSPFVARMTDESTRSQVEQRCKLLLPLTHLKWVLIFLNDFLPVEGERRAKSQMNYDVQEVKLLQLEKAQKRLFKLQTMRGS